MIYVTGDCHGNFRRFQSDCFPEQANMTKDDTVIITGVTGHLDTVYYLKVASVSDSTMTFTDAIGDEASLPTTSAAATIKIHGGVPIEVTSTYN